MSPAGIRTVAEPGFALSRGGLAAKKWRYGARRTRCASAGVLGGMRGKAEEEVALEVRPYDDNAATRPPGAADGVHLVLGAP